MYQALVIVAVIYDSRPVSAIVTRCNEGIVEVEDFLKAAGLLYIPTYLGR